MRGSFVNGLDVCGSGTNAIPESVTERRARGAASVAPYAGTHDETRGRRGAPGGSVGDCRPRLSCTHEGFPGESLDPQRPAKSGNAAGSDQFAAQLPSPVHV